MAATRANQNRKIRQEALREQLAGQGHVQQVIVNIKKLEEQGAAMEPQETQAVKYATDARLKLINKYLPDLKSTELTGEGGGAVAVVDYTQYTDEELQALAEKEGL